ncbi:MAG: hypothetical protein AAF627_21175 [Myxococcota bacterium]
MKVWLARATLLAAVVGSMATGEPDMDFTVFGPELRRSLQPGEVVSFEVTVQADKSIFKNPVPQSIRVEVRPDVGTASLRVQLEPLGFGEPVELEGGSPSSRSGCFDRVTTVFSEGELTRSGTYCLPAPLRCCEAFYRLMVQSGEEVPIFVRIRADALYAYDLTDTHDDFVPEPGAVRIRVEEVSP